MRNINGVSSRLYTLRWKLISLPFLIISFTAVFLNSYAKINEQGLRRIKGVETIINKAEEFSNLIECFVWWQIFIGEQLPFHKTVEKLIEEGKVPRGEAPAWYITSLFLSAMRDPQTLTEEEKSLVKAIDSSISQKIAELAKNLEEIKTVIIQAILEGYQEAMMSNWKEAVYLGEAIPPELSQELRRVLGRDSLEAKKRAVKETLRYMIDCARASQEKLSEDFTKIVDEALGEVLNKIARGEIAIDDFEKIREAIKERIIPWVKRRWEMQEKVVRREVERINNELYINPDIQTNFPFLPLLVKAVLSQEPSILADVEIQRLIISFMEISMDKTWLTQVAEKGSLLYRGSIGFSPLLQLSLIFKAVEEILAEDRDLRLRIEFLLR